MEKKIKKANTLYVIFIIVMAIPSIVVGFLLDIPLASVIILLIVIFMIYNVLQKDKNSSKD